MLEFHKFNEYLIHFSKAFSKLIKEQRALSRICRLKQNPENVHFIFTDSWKAKYARPWVRAIQKNDVSAQKEFIVQFIKCSISNQPRMTSELSSSGQQKQLNLNTTVCKHQSQTLAASSFCESGPGWKGKIMTRKLLCKSRKSLTHVTGQTIVRSVLKAKDNTLGKRGWKNDANSKTQSWGGWMGSTIRLSEDCHECYQTSLHRAGM